MEVTKLEEPEKEDFAKAIIQLLEENKEVRSAVLTISLGDSSDY